MFSPEAIGLIGLGVLLALLMLRAPVGLAMVLVGVAGTYAISLVAPQWRFEPWLAQFKTLLWSTMANYELSVAPLFILMGFLASQARLSSDLFQGLNALVGRFRGGVAMAAIGACAGFGAVSGSSLATASTMGRVALPELRRLNYAPTLATGALAAGGTLGILIPPSVALVVYAIIVDTSVVDMFQAAVLPGLLAVLFFVLVIIVLTRLRPELAPKAARMPPEERRRALRRLLPILLIFGGIIVGLGAGLFAPTPAAAIGATAVLVYGLVLRWRTGDRGLDRAGLRKAFLQTAVTSGMIYFIIFGAEVLKAFFARSGLPLALASFTAESGLDPWTVLVIMLAALIVLGCFMDSLAMILVVLPFLWPALLEVNCGADYREIGLCLEPAFGMAPEDLVIWFGILALVVVELGLITPPVGLNVFIISSLARDVRMGQVFRGVAPFFLVELARVALLLLIPALALYLPGLLRSG